MPIDKIWGEEEKVEWVGQLLDLNETWATFGENERHQLVANFKDLNPDVLGERLVFFGASKHRRSKWMKWLNAIEHLGVPCKDDPNSLVQRFFHIREEPDSAEIEGELIEWVFPRPLAVLTSEDAAHEIYEKLPKPAVPQPAVALAEMEQLRKLWENVKGSESTFRIAAEPLIPEGMTMDAVIESLKG